MKKRKLTVDELRHLDYMVVVWKVDWHMDRDDTWYVNEFFVGRSVNIDGIIEMRLLRQHKGHNNNSSSFEEAMFKSQILFPGKIAYVIYRDSEGFVPPCGYSITSPNVEVFEIEEQEA